MEALWIYIIVSLLLSAFFSGMEIAFISANRLQTELELKQGSGIAKIISWFGSQKSRFIAALLVGNNIALVIYATYTAELLDPVLDNYFDSAITILITQTILATIVVLIVAEFIPKTFFRINPNNVLNIFSPILLLIYAILYIPAWLITKLSDLILKVLFKVEADQKELVFSRVDLDNYLRERTEGLDADKEVETEIQILKNALEFGEIKARECMVPRNEIKALSLDDSIEELTKLFIETGHSKILIYRDSIDNIIGYVHGKELFKQPESIKSLLLPIAIVPESRTADDLLEELISSKRNLAVVVDEFGGTAGMLTMEDVIEELFGDIEDEHDHEALLEIDLGNGRYRFSARHELDYLNEKWKLGLPESDEYDTLAGCILHYHQNIPGMNEEVWINGFRIMISKVSDHRIDEVHLTVQRD